MLLVARSSTKSESSRPRLHAAGPRVWAIVLALALVLPAGQTRAQPGDCIQPSVEGCPVEFGQPVTGVLADPGQVHTWLLTVPTAGDLRVALTNLPEDYDLHVFTKAGAPVVESLNEGTEDDTLQVQGAEPGEYLAYVNSARGGTSPAPYTLLAQLSAAAPQVLAAPSPGRLLSSDDFSGPARGLFLNNQRGVSRASGPASGSTHQWEWDYGYADGALVTHIRGAWDEPGTLTFGNDAEPADSRMFGDFAVEARARATRSIDNAEYALTYVTAANTSYSWRVAPGRQQYRLRRGDQNGNQNLAVGRSTAVNRGNEENLLRIEVRGDTMGGFINGREVDRVQREELATRGGAVRIGFYAMSGPLADGDVEARFTEYRVYALEPQVVESASPRRLQSSDDFSDPARGLFLNNQRGTGRFTPTGSSLPHSYEWDYGYAGGSFVGHVRGPNPQPGCSFGPTAEATDSKMFGDFAVEARVGATRSPDGAEYAVAYFPTPNAVYRWTVAPGTQRYRVFGENRNLQVGRSTAVRPGAEENLLRMEVRGDTMHGFINGQEAARVQHAGLAVRGGAIRIGFFALCGPLADGDVEVRFTDFKVYALDP